MTSGSNHPWTRIGAVLLVAVAWMPVARPGGGDNDSPYNLPKTPNFGTPLVAYSPSAQAIGVAVSGPGSIAPGILNSKHPWLAVPNGVMVDPLAPGDDPNVPSGPKVAVKVAQGDELVVATSGLEQALHLRGTFSVTTESAPLVLRAAHHHGSAFAVLAIGVPNPAGTGLAEIQHFIPFTIPTVGLDLTKLGQQVAATGEFDGKAIEVFLYEVHHHVDGRKPTAHLEATALRMVGSPTQFVRFH